MFRAWRQWLIGRAMDAVMAAAPRLSVGTADRIEAVVRRLGPYCPLIRRYVAENMRSLGVYSPEAHRGYFAQLGAHFAGALHMFRCTAGGRGESTGEELARLVTERIELDESVALLGDAAARGRGAIVMSPHITSYLLGLARLNQEVPLTIYFRHSREARGQERKRRWCQASGIRWLFEPAAGAETGGRVGRIAEALSAGRTVYVPPDLPRKREDGVAVRFFGREIYLPAGAAVLAVRTAAPLFMLLARRSGQRQRLLLRGPCPVRNCGHGPEADRAAVGQHMQWFASLFEQFLIEQTELWYFWGDKRWTRVLHGDPRYVRPLGRPACSGTTKASTSISGVA